MGDAWDGRPQNPERDGWHWVHHKEDLRPIPAMWNAALAGWTCGTLHSPSGIVGLGYTYLGPALLPAEVAAREAAAAEAMREACAAICARHVEPNIARAADKVAAGVGAMAMVARDTIRALPLPAADALARALDRARAEEREACAKTALRTMLPDDCGPAEAHGRFQQAVACCEAIRARGKEAEA